MHKILIDAREYPASTGRYMRKLLEYLEEIDANSERQYVVMLRAADLEAYQPKAQNFQKVVADFKEFTFSEQLGFLRLIRNLKPGLVHFTMVHQPILYLNKKVTTIHDLTTARFYNPSKNWLVFHFKQLVYKVVIVAAAVTSRRIVTISEFMKQDIINYTHVNSGKITVTLEAADKITVPPEKIKRLGGKKFLMYVGRPQPHKNLERLIDAFNILRETHPDLHLVLAGKKDALTERLLEYARKHSISGVIATGHVSEGQLRWLYENCAAYVFPSLSEGFGLPSLEAMAHGAPVVSSNATCLPEINGDAAHYFNPLDIEDMATKINDVLTDKKLRESLIKKGATQVKKYSWKRMAEQTLAIYKSLS